MVNTSGTRILVSPLRRARPSFAMHLHQDSTRSVHPLGHIQGAGHSLIANHDTFYSLMSEQLYYAPEGLRPGGSTGTDRGSATKLVSTSSAAALCLVALRIAVNIQIIHRQDLHRAFSPAARCHGASIARPDRPRT